jgi:hypothetical protein
VSREEGLRHTLEWYRNGRELRVEH